MSGENAIDSPVDVGNLVEVEPPKYHTVRPAKVDARQPGLPDGGGEETTILSHEGGKDLRK